MILRRLGLDVVAVPSPIVVRVATSPATKPNVVVVDREGAPAARKPRTRCRQPSFCLSTSQCAFTVRGEMPSRSDTSWLESPAAMRTITSRCLGVISGTPSTVAFAIARGYEGRRPAAIARRVYLVAYLAYAPVAAATTARSEGTKAGSIVCGSGASW
jgi:hypothetical protein